MMKYFTNIVYAADGGKLYNPLTNVAGNTGSSDTIFGLSKALLSIVLSVGIPFVALVLAYAGFKYIFARGKSDAIKTANFNLTWVLIGIGLFLGAWALSSLIDSTLKSIFK